ncbi:MAG: hypothetical protein HC838_03325 [Spirulinaceae cyanobacterium RM2_2_10]|nr:hypothetical protein [Spirulinaceae cyanobacterium SM2_1_0]NJO19285.1 hypothetical protein [Spirulinaceae cyanobacterium RM2_2_10]
MTAIAPQSLAYALQPLAEEVERCREALLHASQGFSHHQLQSKLPPNPGEIEEHARLLTLFRRELALLSVLTARTELMIQRRGLQPLMGNGTKEGHGVATPYNATGLELAVLFKYIRDAVGHLERGNAKASLKLRVYVDRTLNNYKYTPFFGFFINRFLDFYYSDSAPLKVFSGLAFTTTVACTLIAVGLFGSSAVRRGTSVLDGQIEQLEMQIADLQASIQRSTGLEVDAQGRIIGTVSSQEYDGLGLASAVGAQASELRSSQTQADIEALSLTNVQLASLRSQRAVEVADEKLLFLLLLVAASGLLGSAISILLRIDSFDRQDDRYERPSYVLPIFIGAFKPIIGLSFGLLLFAIMNSGIIPLKIDEESAEGRQEEFFFCAIAFTVGFSERLARDVVKKAEVFILGNSEPPTLPPEAPAERNNRR